ncbi:hypothetical protein Psuf_058310 [Phytohabitans suffuscus]|uniref:Uncharacterized protein n=1 Tax=Phytohabitans suffuscus TaxID=624315 RepID=A0A6F8YRG6_9ACTN|nr:hypothetical protein Psuf_058310 [Phytohabitans suffuscus]
MPTNRPRPVAADGRYSTASPAFLNASAYWSSRNSRSVSSVWNPVIPAASPTRYLAVIRIDEPVRTECETRATERPSSRAASAITYPSMNFSGNHHGSSTSTPPGTRWAAMHRTAARSCVSSAM